MSLKSSDKVETNRYQLEVEVDAAIFEKALEQAYRKENKKIVIPGFRKGKAPRAFVEKYYGEQVFYEDAINTVYPDALDQAVNEAKLEMIEDKIDFDLVSAGKEGVVFKATITTKPEVEIDNYKGMAVTKKPVVVTDEDVDAEIKKVQERNARMITVEDREAQNDDIVVIDFDGSVDGVAFDGGKADNYSLTLGAGQFIPGFEEQVVGHKTGDEFDVTVKFPEDYHAENLAGKDAVFKIKLHEIKMKELPAVDDDFVKDVSDFDSLEKYKEDIRKRLTDAKERAAKDDVENQLIDKLVENVKAEIPQAMYENRINEDIREFSYRLQSQGLNLDTYLKYTGMDKEAFRKQFQPQAERQVKVRLALEQIAKLENIHPTDEEIEEEFAKLAKSYEIDAEKVKAFIPKEELIKDISVEKAINMVRDSAVITEGTEKAE
ncbi:trigger factor [Caproiciproducens galactitolivorans]|uniref:Trigger factor n=1 Tax=Caproiciproducens galactitolivorans TaxID=642589 RepID=A0ABT4BTX3_9FIRM|nr:trigger factor [Caproiciproducens galactitolivorans]MCY1714335.1 trigger factor [Caproiciproducens galactitolivorans]